MKNTNRIYEGIDRPSGDDPGGYDVTMDIITDDNIIDSALQGLMIMFFYAFKEELKTNLGSYITYANFFGEADNYIAQHPEIIINKGEEKAIRTQYAKTVFNEFMENLDFALEYNEKDNTIEFSPYVGDLEHGSYYRPALQLISKGFERFLEDVQKKIDAGYEPAAGSSDSADFNKDE